MFDIIVVWACKIIFKLDIEGKINTETLWYHGKEQYFVLNQHILQA